MIAKTASRKIVVASDRRDLNRTHVHLAIGGLQGADCDVVFLGCAPYPMLNYACRALDIPYALMMTSAEAEEGTIGFRLTIDNTPSASFELKSLFEASRTANFDAISGTGRLAEVDLRHGYLRWLMHGARPSGKPLAVLWNAGNGASTDIVTSLATTLPGRHVVINQGTETPCRPIDDNAIREILTSVQTIALVGASANPHRPSHEVMAFLQDKGYRVIPINPGLAGQILLGETVHASLAEIGTAVDMIDIFRNGNDAGPLVDHAIAIDARVVWMQLGVINTEAAARGEAAGLTVVMDRCQKIEIVRLGLKP